MDRYGLPGIIDEELIARAVFLAKHQLLGGKPPAILIAEHAVLPSVRMSVLVLLPQQEPGDAAAAKLGVQIGEIRAWRSRDGHHALVELGMQRRLIHPRR